MKIKKKNVFDSIKEQIKEKQILKENRAHQFNQIDWQKKSMPELARLVNTIFISEKKQTLNENILIEKISFSGYNTVRPVKDDLERLIKVSSGWLTRVGVVFIRRKRMMDINIVCENMQI